MDEEPETTPRPRIGVLIVLLIFTLPLVLLAVGFGDELMRIVAGMRGK